jgi:hypothetical protein
MAMPEASVHKDSHSAIKKNKIGMTKNVVVSSPTFDRKRLKDLDQF